MNPIPDREEPNVYKECAFADSAMVEIKSGNRLLVEMQYPKRGMKSAEARCFVREEVRQKLLEAAEKLPKGYCLKILDAWRPFALQQELYDVYAKEIIEKFSLEGMAEEEQKRIIRKYVSEPKEDRNIPPVHTTGGAVDVTLVYEDGKEVPMGTGFDDFFEMTDTDYFEKQGSSEEDRVEETVNIRENRRLLYHAMTEVGFTNLPSEWWHFDYGNRFWGYYNQKPAIYRGLFSEEDF